MKNECNIIRDILPLYIEKMVSIDTFAFVEEHLATCAACRAELENMMHPCAPEKDTADRRDDSAMPLKAFKKKWNKRTGLTIVATALVSILVILLVGSFFVVPWPISDVEVTSVWYGGENITDRVDTFKIAEVLSGYSCRLAPWIKAESVPYPVETTLEINLIRNGKPFHIVLGPTAFCYRNASGFFWWTIPEASQMRAELLSLPDISAWMSSNATYEVTGGVMCDIKGYNVAIMSYIMATESLYFANPYFLSDFFGGIATEGSAELNGNTISVGFTRHDDPESGAVHGASIRFEVDLEQKTAVVVSSEPFKGSSIELTEEIMVEIGTRLAEVIRGVEQYLSEP